MATAANQTRWTPATRQYPAPLRRWLACWLLLGDTAASNISSGQRCSHTVRPMMVSDSTVRWARQSVDEHMPAGELVIVDLSGKTSFKACLVDIPTSYGRPADAAAVSLDGESYQLVLAIRRNWVNDWTRPSRTCLITTMSAPKLIHTTPWFEDDAGLTTDDEDSAKALSTRMVVTSRVCEPRSVRHIMTGSRRLARITRDQLFLSFEKAVADSTKSSHFLVGAKASIPVRHFIE